LACRIVVFVEATGWSWNGCKEGQTCSQWISRVTFFPSVGKSGLELNFMVTSGILPVIMMPSVNS